MAVAVPPEERAEPGRRDQILEAALGVFGELGYARATIKRIAAAAGLRSPALIYWYFPDKVALCRAVVQHYGQMPRVIAGANLSSDVAPEVLLERLGRVFLRFFDDPKVQQLFRLAIVERRMLEEIGFSVERDLPGNPFFFLETYFSRQIETGVFLPHDPKMAARSFIAQLWAQVGARHFFPGLGPEPPDDEPFLAAMVPLFLDGVRLRGSGGL